MQARFQNLPFKLSSLDGRNFVLLADAFYVARDGARYCLPAGAASDGASTPPAVWPLVPPFGSYWPAAYLHDTAYRNTLLAFNGRMFAPANLPKEKCDALLLEAMESLGVSAVERQLIYDGVVLGGTSSFDQDRASSGAPVSSSGSFPKPCFNAPGQATGAPTTA
jgi:hypothetical protein